MIALYRRMCLSIPPHAIRDSARRKQNICNNILIDSLRRRYANITPEFNFSSISSVERGCEVISSKQWDIKSSIVAAAHVDYDAMAN